MKKKWLVVLFLMVIVFGGSLACLYPVDPPMSPMGAVMIGLV